jgi:hypothetical protein
LERGFKKSFNEALDESRKCRIMGGSLRQKQFSDNELDRLEAKFEKTSQRGVDELRNCPIMGGSLKRKRCSQRGRR